MQSQDPDNHQISSGLQTDHKTFQRLLVVTTKDMYTTELGLAVYQRQFYIEYGAISAGAVVTIIPMLVVFTILRKNILQGFTTSGIKE